MKVRLEVAPQETLWVPFNQKLLNAAKFLSVLTIVIGGLVLVLPWRQNISVTGQVTALDPNMRPQDIEAPLKGVIKTWHVREGDYVEKGALLVTLVDNDPLYQDRIQQQLNASAQKLKLYEEKENQEGERLNALIAEKGAILDSLIHEVEMIREQVSKSEAELMGVRSKAKTAELNYKRTQELFQKGLRSQRDQELAQMKAETTSAALQQYQAGLSEKRSKLKSTQAKVQEKRAALKAAQAKLNVAITDIKTSQQDAQKEVQEKEVVFARQKNQEIRAARSGMVTQIYKAGANVQVKQGDSLLTMVPQSQDRIVELFVTGRDIVLVRLGTHVRLQFEGWPAIQFAGWPSIAIGSFGGKVVSIQAQHLSSKQGYRVLVEPDGDVEWPDSRFLYQGLKAKGWLILNRVSLGFEIWRQLNGFPPTGQLFDKPEKAPKFKGKKL